MQTHSVEVSEDSHEHRWMFDRDTWIVCAECGDPAPRPANKPYRFPSITRKSKVAAA